MIAYLRGVAAERSQDCCILEAGGVGYQVHMTPSSLSRLPLGETALVYITESTALYGGSTSLYGFLSREEQEIFHTFRDNVPSTGAKKALEFLEKASRSLPDFRRAVLESDAKVLSEVFGFTKKTAEKLIAALKDKLGEPVGHREPRALGAKDGAMSRALEALASLGYKPTEARAALQSVTADLQGKAAAVEDILRLALKRL